MKRSIFALFIVIGISYVWADPSVLTNPGFEAGLTTWGIYKALPDSASMTVVTSPCHSETQCVEITSDGSKEWALNPPTQSVSEGEVWQFSIWVRIDTSTHYTVLSFITRDSSNTVIDWNAKRFTIPSDTGWQLQTIFIAIPKGCTKITPRLIGSNVGHLWVDDADFRKVSSAPTASSFILANDSLKFVLDPLDLSMQLVERIHGDTIRFASIPDLHFDSIVVSTDTLHVTAHHIVDDWKLEIYYWLHNGELRMLLHADSATPMYSDLLVPGPGQTKVGQRLAIPRGTGLAWPVDQVKTDWSFNFAQFSDWQVSQGLTGVSDGKTGFLISIDQPWDAYVSYIVGASSTTLRPFMYQRPSKHVWGHDRSYVIAPLRENGWREMALRHRKRLEEQGFVKTFEEKKVNTPALDRMQGAADFWLWGDWGNLQPSLFDTLRLFGMDKAIISCWNCFAGAKTDTLNSHGWLTSSYVDFVDAYAPNSGVKPINGNPESLLMREDGSYLNGWVAISKTGDSITGATSCSLRHPSLGKSTWETERTTTQRLATFIDVELAINMPECWNPNHPVDRYHDALQRIATFSMARDTFGFVIGGEQTRDYAHAVVDWGEGPMSIASVADAGRSWATPEAPEAAMDKLSMNAATRIPLLPLTDHDAFSPTWYSGDGMSKVPLRWDTKDALSALYVTMPLIVPSGRAMWDSLQSRYMRSINLLGSLHSRCGFAAMIDFKELTTDYLVQQTKFSNGWTVTANFDTVDRTTGTEVIPANGFLAQGGDERIERTYLNGKIRSRVRLQDRWFLDPEGSLAEVDGIRTEGALFMRKENDSTLLLSFVGTQNYVDISPTRLPWPATHIRAVLYQKDSTITVSDVGSNWLHLIREGNLFIRLIGDYSTWKASPISDHSKRSMNFTPKIRANHIIEWEQTTAGFTTLQVMKPNGQIVFRKTVSGARGMNQYYLPSIHGVCILHLQTPDGAHTQNINITM